MTGAPVPDYLHCISIPTPFPVGPVNVYLAEGERLTLVDTGPRYGPARQALADALGERGCRVADLDRILLTHTHADHCGLAAELARISGAELWAHAASVLGPTADRSMVRAWWRNVRWAIRFAMMLRWSGVRLPLMMRLARMRRGMGQYAEPFSLDHTLGDGDSICLGREDWRVLHTPGHTGDLICLYQPGRQLLMSSDHLLRHVSSNPVVDPPMPGAEDPPRRLVQYLEQLRRVEELDVRLALSGHGPPIADHRVLIRRRLAFHEERAERILETVDERALTACEVASRYFPQLDPINAFLAVSEVVGHLQWLETEGQVAHNECCGVARWQALR